MQRKLMSLILPALVIAGAAAGPAAPAAWAKAPSCTRGGGSVVVADGPAVVVRAPHRPYDRTAPKDTDLLTCWKPTGRRARIVREWTTSVLSHVRVVVVDQRYVGTIQRDETGVHESVKAYVNDARTGTLVHDSSKCDVDLGDLTGIMSAAFLPGGGLAFACGPLYLFRTADVSGDPELLDAGDGGTVVQVAASTDETQRPRVYWTVMDKDGKGTVKSVEIEPTAG